MQMAQWGGNWMLLEKAKDRIVLIKGLYSKPSVLERTKI